MAYMPLCAFMNAFLLVPVALAIPWIGATPTPAAGIMALNGMSPRPTEAPMVGNIPRELLKRDQQYIFPPPRNWCGFIDGSYSFPLECPFLGDRCFIGTSGGIGCGRTSSNCVFYTDCDDATTRCVNCDDGILYCSQSTSHCASYVFASIPGAAHQYTSFYCDLLSSASYTVEFLNDFYATAIGSTIGENGSPSAVGGGGDSSTDSGGSSTDSGDSFSDPGDSSNNNEQFTTSASAGSYTSETAETAAQTATQRAAAAPHKGFAVGAIAGIAGGAGFIALAAVAGLIVCFCMRKRRRNRAAAAPTQPPTQATFNHNPPMQQTVTNQAYPNTAQNVQYPPRPSALNEPPQYPGSPQTSTSASTYTGYPSPINSPLLAHDPTNRMSTISPPPLPYKRSATTSIHPLSPKPSILSDVKMDYTPSYPQTTTHPTPTDAGGMGATMGHAAATNEKDRFHEVSGVPMHIQGQNPTQTQQGQSHEVSTQSEPRYTAYSRPTTQQGSSYTTYTQSSVDDGSGTQSPIHTQITSSQERLNNGQPSVWELPEQRGLH